MLNRRAVTSAPWSPDSWKTKVDAQAIAYDDAAALDRACARLSGLPPLVTSWEIERLKELLAEAQRGKRFLLQGGDCAETLADCRSPVIADKLKILLQMSLVMVHESKRPVVRVGRLAGQYAKPRSKAVEARDGVEHPSYFGDMVNRADFSKAGRRPDPDNLIVAYNHCPVGHVGDCVHRLKYIGERLRLKRFSRFTSLPLTSGGFERNIIAEHRLASLERVLPPDAKVSTVKIKNLDGCAPLGGCASVSSVAQCQRQMIRRLLRSRID